MCCQESRCLGVRPGQIKSARTAGTQSAGFRHWHVSRCAFPMRPWPQAARTQVSAYLDVACKGTSGCFSVGSIYGFRGCTLVNEKPLERNCAHSKQIFLACMYFGHTYAAYLIIWIEVDRMISRRMILCLCSALILKHNQVSSSVFRKCAPILNTSQR